MKTLLLFLSTGACVYANAQTTFNYSDSVNINHINARVLLHGDMWWDPVTQVAKCEFPKGSGKHIGFASALWMSGIDEASQTHVSAQTYRDSNDYWPGPLDASGNLSYAQSTNWARFWKVRYTDLQYFQSLSTHTVANTPEAILSWPASGNTNATGNALAPLSIPAGTAMAPFKDLNSNGIYEPLLGEYPDIKGDEAIWWTFSDNGPTHNQTNGLPIGVEVHAMSYGYNRGTLLDNVVYYEYTLTNKSTHTYTNFRIAQFSDADLGYFNDDFIGFDSTHRMSIFYNGTADDGASAGHPLNSYGIHSPVQGTTMIALPGDTGSSHVPAGSFIAYNNDFSVIGNPTNYIQYDYYIRGLDRTGAPFMNNSVTPPVPTNYLYTGDPSDTSGWSECAMHDVPGDRRTVLSSDGFTFAPGQTVKIVMALVVTDTNQGGCPNVGFQDIRKVADTAWANYQTPPPVIPSGVSNTDYGEYIKIFPNPAQNKLYINMLYGAHMEYVPTIHNTLGQQVNATIQPTGGGYEIDVTQLPTGVYYLGYVTNGVTHNIKFIKQ